MPARIPLASLLTIYLAWGTALAEAQLPFSPTAGESNQREAWAPEEAGRGYQNQSVESLQGRTRRAAAWVKERLSGLHITPTRLLCGLGLIGVLYSWNKNKRKVGWAVLTVLAWLLLLGGVVAILRGGT